MGFGVFPARGSGLLETAGGWSFESGIPALNWFGWSSNVVLGTIAETINSALFDICFGFYCFALSRIIHFYSIRTEVRLKCSRRCVGLKRANPVQRARIERSVYEFNTACTNSV